MARTSTSPASPDLPASPASPASQIRPLSTGTKLGAVFLGGCLGTFLRVTVSHLTDYTLGPHVPLSPAGTHVDPWYLLVVNVVGALLLGALTGWELRRGRLGGVIPEGKARRQEWFKLMLGTGLCGSFTTYGSLIMLTVSLDSAQTLPLAYALAWTILILVAGLIAATLGWAGAENWGSSRVRFSGDEGEL